MCIHTPDVNWGKIDENANRRADYNFKYSGNIGNLLCVAAKWIWLLYYGAKSESYFIYSRVYYEIEFSVADKENYYDIKQYANPTELTAELLNTLIEKIVIHEAATVDGMREQDIDIYYRFIGKIE